MREVTATGKTVPEAIEAGLAELGLTREQVEIEVLELPSKGMFGILPGKNASVLIKEVFDAEKYIGDWYKELFAKMELDAVISCHTIDRGIQVDVRGRDLGALIGRHGQTLDSLQYLGTLVLNRRLKDFTPVTLDVGDYRKKRHQSLESLAVSSARKVKKLGQKVILNPMSAAERRIIHMTLSNDNEVQTYSTGEEPRRRVVIEKKSK